MSEAAPHHNSASPVREFLIVVAAWLFATVLSFGMSAFLSVGNLLFLIPGGLAAFAMFRGAYLSAEVSQALALRAAAIKWLAFVVWLIVFALALAAGAFAGLSLPGAGQAMGDMLAIG